tara:strand:- start:203 stop:445 length:243 start_codon:yes stop_codon:yes gene_type:complete
MQTFNIYRGYDRDLTSKLGVAYSMAEAKRKARNFALNANMQAIPYDQYQCSVITVRDVLGGLRFEVNLRAPEQHQEKETK